MLLFQLDYPRSTARGFLSSSFRKGKKMFSKDLLQGDVLANIANYNCPVLSEITEHQLASYIVGIANTEQGGCLVIGINESNRTTVTGTNENETTQKYLNVINKIKGVDSEIKFANGIRGFFTLAFIDIQPSSELASFDGIVYTLINGKPKIMPEKEILNRLGLGLNSDLLNNISFQIHNQSSKLESLQQELVSAKSLKVKIKEWLFAGIVGAIISMIISNIF